ncbi:LysR substrate-binding domain-containing protein [Antarcticimicrobium sediminis]|uniref:LysR family transcriptional regulator n=1 Tax=Antarcticimicrobium sediminis TaxID=2546227 RepID=A0A4V2Z8P6_9RHOB|nr:LysR substrate-binding domain-containing protein [Antarcticimicrobium sediminis]MDX2484872.1 LysR substrate-binding domain-containing protein [Pseudodonghicola sp.]TDE41136.1 LysR family transcriptional regulator [Antarcticimicrobium sediminis]
MKIDLVDLRLFVHVAECSNLTHGAGRAFLSVSAASARIKAMERETGQQLFLRGNRGISLTSAGEVFLRQARLVLRQMDFLADEMLNAEVGHIRLYANTTAVTEFLPEILALFLSDRPGVTVDLQERLTNDIIRSVVDGSADMGIISGEVGNDGLEAIRFSTDRLMLAVPNNHPLSSHDRVQFRQTLDFEHIGLHEGSTLLDFLRHQFRRNGYNRTLRIQVRSFEAMCRIIEAGVGIGIVPESAARRHVQTMDIKLLELEDDWALRDRSVLVRSRKSLPRSALTLIEMLIKTGAGGGRP